MDSLGVAGGRFIHCKSHLAWCIAILLNLLGDYLAGVGLVQSLLLLREDLDVLRIVGRKQVLLQLASGLMIGLAQLLSLLGRHHLQLLTV